MSRYHQRLNVLGQRWQVLRRQVFERDGWRCVDCGRAGRLECDHVRPLELGGEAWDIGNLATRCRGCHIRKTRRENVLARRRPPTPAELRWRALLAATLARRH